MSRIVYMRNFNNWIKSIFLSKFIGQIREESHDDIKIIALDMCCGKGGDLMKWQKANIRHLICADIAETSISQCKERYEHLKKRGRIFSAEFVVADCTKTRLKQHLEVPEKKLDIVSCQFAFHYCFESLSQAETMIRNVSDVLRKGGYFIATIPDANKILICKKYDLELVYNKSFEELYETGVKDRENRSLLFRMKALEMYPAVHGANLSSSNEEEYCHVGEDSKERNTSSVKTMSKSEWEAICLYMAFAFKKVT
ncbi:mRNA cap guanine-N7 methyltransferase [Armadillidium vulgare]|nr:mRNA cap guanine-N7 methyltransferase [Armadillidium vulgare]